MVLKTRGISIILTPINKGNFAECKVRRKKKCVGYLANEVDKSKNDLYLKSDCLLDDNLPAF
jgi:hypothetical protein